MMELEDIWGSDSMKRQIDRMIDEFQRGKVEIE